MKAIPYALRFGGATSDRVNVTSTALITNLDPWTVIFRGMTTTLTGGKNLFGKGTAGGNSRHIDCHLNLAGGEIAVTLDRATTDLQYTSTSAPLATINQPFTLAVTFRSANSATDLVRAYVSYNNAAFTTVTWGGAGQTDGSGAFQSDSTFAFTIGNLLTTTAYQGVIWEVMLFNAEFTPGQLAPFVKPVAPTPLALGWWVVGANGAAPGPVLDRSGHLNHGVITGAVPAAASYVFAGGGA